MSTVFRIPPLRVRFNWRADRDGSCLLGSGFNLVIERNWPNDHKTSYFPIFRWACTNAHMKSVFSLILWWHGLTCSDVRCHRDVTWLGERGQCFIVIRTLCLCWILKVNGAFMLQWPESTWFSYLYVHIYMHNWANSSKLTSCYCIQMTSCTNKQKS